MSHFISQSEPLLGCTPPTKCLSDSFFNRLVNFYHLSAVKSVPMTHIWDGIHHNIYGPILDALNRGSGLRNLLEHLYTTEMLCGLDGPYSQKEWEWSLIAAGISFGVIP